MKPVSYVGLFERPNLNQIVIPIIQRDYAQGRREDAVDRIRRAFLGVLHEAVTIGPAVGLDFVYGNLTNGRLTPLDGQQRLTTLFLLHLYIAANAGERSSEIRCLRGFTYETRFSARDFCQGLVGNQLPEGVEPAGWIRDQHWFQIDWPFDPTIQSMLVVLDDIHNRFKDQDFPKLWSKLIDPIEPPIVFHYLSIEEMGLTDDLYLKMNSRGKPLTPFELFKAEFEGMLKPSHEPHFNEFIRKVDNDWADLLWPLRGADHIVDDEFIRYFRYVSELIQRSAIAPVETDESVAERAYGSANPDAIVNQRFLFDALDCWCRPNASALPGEMFIQRGHAHGKVTIYEDPDLFAACCREYGVLEGRVRRFSLAREFLLFAVIVHLVDSTEEFPRRVRILRNLIFGSQSEVRLENLRELLDATSTVIRTGTLPSGKGFNTRQVGDEESKADFLLSHPALVSEVERLEDHFLLRGSIGVFDLEPTTLSSRANAFRELFNESDGQPRTGASAALLTRGDYSKLKFGRYHQFGSENVDVWRELLSRDPSARTRTALLELLDAVRDAPGSIDHRLAVITSDWLVEREKAQAFDWRYYLVKYPEMRWGKSGLYVPSDGKMGFQLCMLDKTQLNSNYRDPYLLALWKQSDARDEDVETLRFTGYETTPRWLRLSRSGVELTCIPEGFLLKPPPDAGYREKFESVLMKHGVEELRLRIPQIEQEGAIFDQVDRVIKGAALTRDLLQMNPNRRG